MRFLIRRHVVEPVRILLRDEPGRKLACQPARMLHQRREKRDVVLDALDHEFVERLRLRIDRRLPRRAVRDQLRDHRVVEHRDLAALENPRIVAHRDPILAAPLRRRLVAHEAPDRGQEVAVWILRIDPAFHRPALQADLVLRNSQRLAGGHADHLLDKVNAGDEFGYRVLDLKACIHFEKIERLVLARDELDGAGRVIIHRLRQRDGLRTHLLTRLLVEKRRRRLLDDLLVSPLDRALPLAQVNHVAVLVTEHLDLDVPGIGDELLDEDAIVTEARGRFRLRELEALGNLLRAVGDPHPLPAPAGGCLDDHRVSDVVRDRDRLLRIVDDAHITRHRGDVGGRCGLFRLDLVPHRRDCPWVRADEGDAILRQRAGELLALREEAVAGVHRIGPRLLAGLDDLFDHEVGFGCRRRTDEDRLVGGLDVQRQPVGLGKHGDGRDSHAARGLDHPAGNFPTIGNENLLEHRVPGPFGPRPAPASAVPRRRWLCDAAFGRCQTARRF